MWRRGSKRPTRAPSTMTAWLAIAVGLSAASVGCEGSSALPAEVEVVVGPVPATIEWEAASEAVDFDRLRELFTEDGAFFAGGAGGSDAEALHGGDDEMRGALGVDGREFDRRHTIHRGDDLSIVAPVQVGDRSVAFGWGWTQFAAGVGTMALRDGRIAVLTLTVEPVYGGVSPSAEPDPILGEFETASESGDAERLHALFNTDAVVMTSFELLALYHGNSSLEGERGIDGQVLAGWAADHRGEDLHVAHAVQVGDGIAFAWAWEEGDAGTAVMQLRDGRIQMLVLTHADEEV